MTVTASKTEIVTLADLLERLGGVPLDRVRFRPGGGTATEKDVADIDAHEGRLFELVDGVLVEKGMGFEESILASAIITALSMFVVPRKLGVVAGEGGMMRLVKGLVRIPDVAYVSNERLRARIGPAGPIPALAPDLAVEVLSKSNTKAEMKRKRREYFAAGVLLLWEVDPKTRTVAVFTTAEEFVTLDETQILDGGEVLPGFHLSLHDLFAELDKLP